MLNDVLSRVEERLQAVGLTASAASTKAGLSRDAIRNMQRAVAKKGREGVSTKTITALAPVLQTTPGWLLNEEGEQAIEHIPLVSWVSAGNLRRSEGVTEADIEKYVPVCNLPKGDWIALEVSGDSMNRIAPEGSILVVNRADDTLLNDRYYVFALEGGEATFKRYRRDPRPMLQPFSTNLDHLSIPVSEDEFYVIGRVRRVITDL